MIKHLHRANVEDGGITYVSKNGIVMLPKVFPQFNPQIEIKLSKKATKGKK